LGIAADQPMVKPKIGLSTLYCLSEPFKKVTKRIAKAETAYIEIVDEGLHALDKRRVKALNELAASHSLKYTVHSPFADINIASPSKPLLNTMLKRLKKSIIHASALNCQIWVFHSGLKTGVSMFYPSMGWTQNTKSARSLYEFASDHGLRIAIENTPEPYPFLMTNVEEFKRFYNEVNEDIGMILDIAHAHINGQIESFLVTFADKIVHMHAHDNNGESDQHLGIGYGNIDWKKVAALTKKISYGGIITVESVEHVEQSIVKLKRLFA
jgi:sugar phosphate isomerase/epimerase